MLQLVALYVGNVDYPTWMALSRNTNTFVTPIIAGIEKRSSSAQKDTC